MPHEYDTIILGLGAMGSAAAWQLARRGNRVLGIDRHSPPHTHGSTHGDTRITRLAIGEGAHYTPLALRSHELWREIEAATGASLLTQTGGLIISSAAKTGVNHVEGFFDNTLAAARQFGIRHEVLDAREIRRRFPPFKVRDDEVGYYEFEAGFLRPEACVAAQLVLAQRHGAAIHCHEAVQEFEEANGRVRVTTDRDTYTAARLVVCAGPWLPQLLGEKYRRCFAVTRQALFWFGTTVPIETLLPPRFPIFIWELQGNAKALYGFPAIDGPGGGIKIATEQTGITTTVDAVNREVSAEEVRVMHEQLIASHIDGIDARCLRATTCLYTTTPDSGFVIDAHPEHPAVIIASPCSGHGFKHSAAIGEILADLATTGQSPLDISAFRLGRFATAAGTV